MKFNPGLEIGQILKNDDIVNIFKCGNMGGVRRSKATNTLVIVSDYTKGLYHDKWIGGVLHYTGMGKLGDQDIQWAQNATLAKSGHNGIDIHLFEVINPKEYIYCGRVELVEEPYTEIQSDEEGIPRRVWMFPVQPVPYNDVEKPQMFVFKDMEDYKTRGKNVDEEYAKILAENKKNIGKSIYVQKVNSVKELEHKIEIPEDVVGKKIKHKKYGIGTITEINGKSIYIVFDNEGEKKMVYDICIKNKIFEFI